MKTLLTIIVLLTVGEIVEAQTRFYTVNVTPLVAPPLNAGWNVTTGNAAYLLNTYRLRNAINLSLATAASGAASPRKMIWAQFVTPPLLRQTLNGTLTGQFRMVEGNTASVTSQGFVYLRLINANGSVASEIGTLITIDNAGALTNRTFIAFTLPGVVVTGGQRLAVDYGFNYSVGTLTTNTGTTALNDALAIDLPVDNTTTAGGNNWLEFSQTIRFQSHTGFF
jgi:hypothetical protein